MSDVLIRADASPRLGGGHVMRMLTLADALAERGARVSFAVNAQATGVVPRLAASPYAVWTAPSDADPHALLRAAPARPDVVVVDHYAIDAKVEAVWRDWAGRLAAVDDLADRPHDADLILDASPGRDPRDYDGLAPANAQRLIGVSYALLRPAFLRLRPEALARRREGGGVSRVLVTLGLTDVGAITQRVAAALAASPLIADIDIDVVLGHAAPSRPALAALAARNPGLHLHVDAKDMAGLMASADLALGAGGQTSLERACLGLPSVTLVLADNQRAAAGALERAGAAVTTKDVEAAVAKLVTLSGDEAARRAMSARGGALVDGQGAQRSADAIAALWRDRPRPRARLR